MSTEKFNFTKLDQKSWLWEWWVEDPIMSEKIKYK